MACFKHLKLLTLASLAVIASSAPYITSGALAKDEAKRSSAPTGKISKAAQKTLVELQDLVKKQDWAGVKAKIVEAEAIPGRNSYDNFFIANFKYNAGVGLKEDPLIISGLEGMLNSEFTPPEQRPQILRNLMSYADRAKDFAKANALGEQYLQLAPNDSNVIAYLGQIALRAKDFARADALLLNVIKTDAANGRPTEEDVYMMLASAREQAKAPNKVEALRLLATKYPSARNWAFVLEDFQVRSGLNGRNGIDLFRLMNAAGALSTGSSVIEAAQVALDAGVPGDAKAFLEKAQAAGTLKDRKADATTLLRAAMKAIAADEPAAKQEAAANTGDRLGAVGQLYLSLGNYWKARDVLSRALAKGLRNKNEAYIRLGIAQFMQGETVSAKQAWGSVSGDPKLSELGMLWSLYADTHKP